jgi:glycosyltransferase involved in cell wall biosynthesis
MAQSKSSITKLDLSIVVPVYNERENLIFLEEAIENALNDSNYKYEIVFVDDGSIDDSAKIILALRKQNPKIRLIRLDSNSGQTAAFGAGFSAAKGKYVATMDADLQNDPADIPKLLEKTGEFDVVCGWRFKRNDTWIKKVSSKIANRVRNFVSEDDIEDTGCSLKVFRRECLQSLKLFKGMHRFFPTLLKMEGYKISQVKVSHNPRKFGESHYNIRNRLIPSLVDLLAVRWMQKRKVNYKTWEEK